MSEQVDLKTIPVSPEGENGLAANDTLNDRLVTVFDDKDNFNVKHPLENHWTLWFTKPSSGKVGGPAPTASASVSSCTDFCACRATTGMIF